MTIPAIMAAQDFSGDLGGHFTWIDWTVVFAYLAIATVLGAVLAGRQKSIKDFFLGGRKLPWYAVAGSSIATEISAITFVSVPFIVFQPGGNFTYLQLGLVGGLLARLVVAYVLVPAYFQREIYSPYDYMGHQLGPRVKSMTTALFTLGGILAQSARVYLTALILALVLHGPLGTLEAATGIPALVSAILIIGVVSIGWTLLGGMATVIWTDLILFGVFVVGALTALGVLIHELDTSPASVLGAGWDAGKFELWNFTFDPTLEFTIWTAAIAATWANVGAFGTDQLMTQRLFCCRNARDARRAVIASYFGLGITVLVSLVGVGLWYYYQQVPLQGEALAAFERRGDSIFPIFILTVIPTGLTGLIVAGIFAAAISSLDSILAALSQTTVSAFYLPRRNRRHKKPSAREERHRVRVSRAAVVFWGVVLCALAIAMDRVADDFDHLLGLALGMAGFVSGGLMAGFFLGFFSRRLNIDGGGFLFAAPLGVLTVLAVTPFNRYGLVVDTCLVGALAVLISWLAVHRQNLLALRGALQTLLLLGACALVVWLAHNAYFQGPVDPGTGEPSRRTLAWPWFAPVGSTVTFFLGWLLAGKRNHVKR